MTCMPSVAADEMSSRAAEEIASVAAEEMFSAATETMLAFPLRFRQIFFTFGSVLWSLFDCMPHTGYIYIYIYIYICIHIYIYILNKLKTGYPPALLTNESKGC